MLLELWMRNFPPKVQGNAAVNATTSMPSNATGTNANAGKYALTIIITIHSVIKIKADPKPMLCLTKLIQLNFNTIFS